MECWQGKTSLDYGEKWFPAAFSSLCSENPASANMLCGSAPWPPRNSWLPWISSSHRQHQHWLITVATGSDCSSWSQAGGQRSQGSWKRAPGESPSQGLAIFTRCHARLFLPTGLQGARRGAGRSCLPKQQESASKQDRGFC